MTEHDTGGLINREQRFRAFVTASSDVVYRMSPDWSEMWHLEGHAFIADTVEPSRTWLDRYIDPDDQAHVWAAIQHSIRNRTMFDLEHRVIGVGGTLGWTHSRAIPILDDRGEIIEWFGAAKDVTRRRLAEDALRANEQRFRTLVERSPFGMYIVDATFRIAHMNKSSHERAFVNVRPVIGRPFDEVVSILWPEEVARQIIRIFRHTLATGDAYRSEDFVSMRADKQQVEGYEWELHQIDMPDGSKGVICYYYDSTPLRETERRLGEAVSQLRRSAEAAAFLAELSDLLARLDDLDELINVAGAKLAAHLKLSSVQFDDVDDDQGVTRVPYGWYAPEATSLVGGLYRHDDYVAPELLSAHRQGEVLVVNDTLSDPRTRAGAYRPVGIRAFVTVPFRREGKWRYTLAVTDSSQRDWRNDEVALIREAANRIVPRLERARAEAALRESETRLRLAQKGGGVGVWDWLSQNDATYWSETMWSLYGREPVAPSVPIQEIWHASLHPDDRPRVLAHVATAFASSDAEFQDEFRIIQPDGSERWLESVAQIERDPTGKPRRMSGVNRDITARKCAEQALREADRRKDEFLATLAHELRNPLAPIRTGLELIRLAGDTPAAVQRVRSVMERQVAHMVRLIDDLLDVSRITSGKIQLQRRPSLLSDLVAGAVEANRALIVSGGLELAVRLPEPSPVINVDPTRFVQVVSNLLHNAVKFTPPSGRIDIAGEIRTRSGDPSCAELLLRVTDTGVGMSEQMLPRVFDLFTQGEESATRSHGGLGIGLALARQLIEMHGGTIAARSGGRGQGSEFSILIPVWEAAGTTESPSRDVPHAVLRRVVIIDDNRDAAETLASLVHALGGQARTAHDGASGLVAVREFHPDVVLLDIGMPGMDGYETCRRLRKEHLAHELVVVALTGWGQEQDRQRAFNAGFDAHMTKPADPLTLRTLLAEAPSRQRSQGA